MPPILQVSVPFFSKGRRVDMLSKTAPSPAHVNEFVSSEDGLRLIKAFMRISRSARQRIVDFVQEIGTRDGGRERTS
jgi:hypothetical protein